MADKELRKMNRTELIEIIYALQQNERTLRQENEDLRAKLEDRTIRLERSGSIAEAALNLNHIFEDAGAAAQQYLDSLKVREAEADQLLGRAEEECAAKRAETERECEAKLSETERQCKAKLSETGRQCEAKLSETERECEARISETEQECRELLTEAKQRARDRVAKANRQINQLLNKYPMLREYLEKESEQGGKST